MPRRSRQDRLVLPCHASGSSRASRDGGSGGSGGGGEASSASPARPGCTCGKRLLLCLGFLYFQLSTFTLVQWVRNRASESEWRGGVRWHGAASGAGGAAPPAHAGGDWPPPSPPHQAALDRELVSEAEVVAAEEDEGEAERGEEQREQREWQEEQQEQQEQEQEEEREEALGGGVGGADGGGGGGGGVGGGGGGGGGAPVAGKVEGWKESDEYGKFIGISTFFNPGRHENKVDNFRHFRASVSAQGLQLLCVELTFGVAPPQLAPHDCDILLHRNTAEGNRLWQKERLLNIALQSLPASVEKVMWLDTDLIFLNDNWVPETAALLDEYSVVQPFGWMTYLPASAGGDGSSYVAKLGQLPLGMGVGAVYHSAGLGVSTFGDSAFSSSFLLGHPGFAWAARREGHGLRRRTESLSRIHSWTLGAR